jgi:hypothetical protein
MSDWKTLSEFANYEFGKSKNPRTSQPPPEVADDLRLYGNAYERVWADVDGTIHRERIDPRLITVARRSE